MTFAEQLINVGCEKMWPKGQPIGGIPSEIQFKFFKVRGIVMLVHRDSAPTASPQFLAISCSNNQLTPSGSPQVCDDASKFDVATLADHAQQVMQAELDRVYAAQDAGAGACAAAKHD